MGVPVGQTVQAPAVQLMIDNEKGLLIQQKLDLQEVFCPACQKRNKYKIRSDMGWDSTDCESFEQSPWKQAPQVMFAKEESDTCERICCQKWRSFQMYIRPGKAKEGPYQYKLDRPFKCTCMCGPLICNPQELTIYDHNDVMMGQAVQDWRCLEACCCKSYWRINDANGSTQYFYQQDYCKGNNFCAPSCCCATHHIDILSANETPTDGFMRNIFPGCNWKAFAGAGGLRDSYHLKFPSDASPHQKALLMGGLFLIEFMVFEKDANDDQGVYVD